MKKQKKGKTMEKTTEKNLIKNMKNDLRKNFPQKSPTPTIFRIVNYFLKNFTQERAIALIGSQHYIYTWEKALCLM